MEASFFRRQAAGQAYDFLPPEPSIRQVRRMPRMDDVADAEFVVVGKAKPQGTRAGVRNASFNDNSRRTASPKAHPSGPLATISATLLGTEVWLQQASLRGFAALVISLFVLVFGLAGGFSGLSQGGTSPTDTLHFSHVTITPRDANGMRILLINGIIENDSGVTQQVRPIRADLVSDERLTASIVIEPPTDVVYAGQSRGFSARVQHAGGKLPEVRLSFMP
ncbi:hypothetical protein FHX08_004714 [Rhizobium sp. BK529]|uniref:hypothetical protein n=1 Tax=unclassified Rhizobium TaxID=2613769 RepID=UPI001042FF81|nr:MULTISPECIES: hypothetical protein [unclassified Rhizobium]MBB3594310.1 hypothetical protein [Rhizobium sp. BK529]TCS02102.1 hypothetical protein EV281_10553 [Rhizobium sp. BK418]